MSYFRGLSDIEHEDAHASGPAPAPQPGIFDAFTKTIGEVVSSITSPFTDLATPHPAPLTLAEQQRLLGQPAGGGGVVAAPAALPFAPQKAGLGLTPILAIGAVGIGALLLLRRRGPTSNPRRRRRRR